MPAVTACVAGRQAVGSCRGFEAELRTYLERLAQIERTGRAPVHRRVDEHALRVYFLNRLRALEEMREGRDHRLVKRLFSEWSPRLGCFAEYIAGLPLAVAPATAAEAQVFAERALEMAMELAPRDSVEQLELERVASGFEHPGPVHSVEEVERYAVETYLVRDEAVIGTRPTTLGTAFLRLHGKDAIRWLITCELLQSTGPWDRWRTPRQLLESALEDGGIVPRLAAEDVAEQTKLIAHEVRNALVPARIQLEALRAAVPEPHLASVEAAKRGVTRVLAFVEEMLATSELIAEQSTPCELAALVREAISCLEDGERIRVRAASGSLRVRVPRTQLVRALSNVLRNALQATHETRPVEISTPRVDAAVRIVVDDSGPGVPEHAREHIFVDGYTTRTDGSGYGLAYVRRVVADGLRGRVWCEASHLGGARFVIELLAIEAGP